MKVFGRDDRCIDQRRLTALRVLAFADQWQLPEIVLAMPEGKSRPIADGGFFHARQRPDSTESFPQQHRFLRGSVVNVGVGIVGIRKPGLDCHDSVGLKPSCTLNKSQKLRSRSPAATISTRESANSPITRTWRKRERRREPLEPRPSCRSVVFKSRRLVSHAGASPKMVPAATETTMANASTPQLMDMSLRCGRLSGTNCSRNFLAQKRTAKPVMPPSTKSSKLSVRS